MYTIITFPADAGYAKKLAIIEVHTVGCKPLEDYDTLTGARLLFAVSSNGHYLIYVHGGGYHRMSVTTDKDEAMRLLGLLKEVHCVEFQVVE